MKTDIEKEIGEVFDKLLKKHNNVAFIFSYTYEDASNGKEAEIKGRTGVYGPKEIIDILIEQSQEFIEENTKEDFVNV